MNIYLYLKISFSLHFYPCKPLNGFWYASFLMLQGNMLQKCHLLLLQLCLSSTDILLTALILMIHWYGRLQIKQICKDLPEMKSNLKWNRVLMSIVIYCVHILILSECSFLLLLAHIRPTSFKVLICHPLPSGVNTQAHTTAILNGDTGSWVTVDSGSSLQNSAQQDFQDIIPAITQEGFLWQRLNAQFIRWNSEPVFP